MSARTLSELQTLLSNHQKRTSRLWGELFALWGLLVIGATLLELYVWSSIWLWPGMIGVGLAAQFGYVRSVERRAGECTLKLKHDLFVLWMSITLVVLPLVALVMPLVFKIYPSTASLVLITVVLALGMWVSGFIGRSGSFKVGAVVLLLGGVGQACALLLYQRQTLADVWVFILTILCGLVVPGIVSCVHEQH